MDARLQAQTAFFLTGRREGEDLQPLDGRYRQALLSRLGDLSSLRYDFPLVLNRDCAPERAVLSLSGLVDEAVESLAGDPSRDRIARHGYEIEREIRASAASGDFQTCWKAAATKLAGNGSVSLMDSADRLWSLFGVSGDLVDADAALPAKVFTHLWRAVQAQKSARFHSRAERLLFKLRDILAAEMVDSPAGRAPDRLKAGVGSAFASSFDFEAMSRILQVARPGSELTDQRRQRIHGLISVLELQRFYPLGDAGPDPYDFVFERCSDALDAYQKRHEEAVQLCKALAVAELETTGEYREAKHDVLFDGFGANGLDASELAELPDYLILANSHSLDANETSQVVELLAAGVPVKVVFQTDDVLEPSRIAEGHVALGLRARQLVNAAIGLSDVLVLQAGASYLPKMGASLLDGLNHQGPALFSVFSGSNKHTGDLPPYLVSAAAVESRAFPCLLYDPAAGSDWATRLRTGMNPQSQEDWPIHAFMYEDQQVQARSEDLPFTLADFMAMDERFSMHFALLPKSAWSEALVPVPDALEVDQQGLPSQLPSIMVVDKEGLLHRAIFDARTLQETRRCLTMWRSLRELGSPRGPAGGVAPEVAEELAPQAVVEEIEPAPAVQESHGNDPYIETARCTSCNECTGINNKMFAYNADKQAYIADPDAGTFRQLVEAAEGCQVSIIHPGKPRNPKEPGLEDLIKRAAAFN